jgi:hypothetical protein
MFRTSGKPFELHLHRRTYLMTKTTVILRNGEEFLKLAIDAAKASSSAMEECLGVAHAWRSRNLARTEPRQEGVASGLAMFVLSNAYGA